QHRSDGQVEIRQGAESGHVVVECDPAICTVDTDTRSAEEAHAAHEAAALIGEARGDDEARGASEDPAARRAEGAGGTRDHDVGEIEARALQGEAPAKHPEIVARVPEDGERL